MNKLMHCGAAATNMLQLETLPAPVAQGRTHHPIPHHEFAQLVLRRMEQFSYDIAETEFYLGREGNQMFGLAKLQPTGLYADLMAPVVGFRNSHDMSFSAGVAMGARVFVCDNLAFSGEIVIQRKHTRHIMDDLPDLIDDALTRLVGVNANHEQRVASYRNTPVYKERAARIMLEAHALKLVNNRDLQPAWSEYRLDPLGYDNGHDAPSFWRLYNSITHFWKQSPNQYMGPIHGKSRLLHELLDEEASTT